MRYPIGFYMKHWDLLLNWKISQEKIKLWTKEHNFKICKYKTYANSQIIPRSVLRLRGGLKVMFLWFGCFQGLCRLLDYLSACRGDLQRQPAPKWLGLHPVVQHAGDRTQGMENISVSYWGVAKDPCWSFCISRRAPKGQMLRDKFITQVALPGISCDSGKVKHVYVLDVRIMMFFLSE